MMWCDDDKTLFEQSLSCSKNSYSLIFSLCRSTTWGWPVLTTCLSLFSFNKPDKVRFYNDFFFERGYCSIILEERFGMSHHRTSYCFYIVFWRYGCLLVCMHSRVGSKIYEIDEWNVFDYMYIWYNVICITLKYTYLMSTFAYSILYGEKLCTLPCGGAFRHSSSSQSSQQ